MTEMPGAPQPWEPPPPSFPAAPPVQSGAPAYPPVPSAPPAYSPVQSAPPVQSGVPAGSAAPAGSAPSGGPAAPGGSGAPFGAPAGWSAQPGWPAPVPPGPGATVPFAVPPTERNRKRMWIGLGVAGAVLLLCCVGGTIGLVTVVVSSLRGSPEQAAAVVTTYLTDLGQGAYSEAYDQLCTEAQQQESEATFEENQRDRAQIVNFTVGTPKAESSGYAVPADIELDTGASDNQTFHVIVDQTAGLRICGTT